ncbi:MAG: polyprenyl synthetase family protein [Bacteroidota bacterium]
MKSVLGVSELRSMVEEAINKIHFPTSPADLYDPITYMLALEGKRMRPVLALAGANLFTDELSSALSPALGLEVFHNFTLLHDDIMDNAPLRRSMETVHTRWNPNVAILSGDTMFVKSCQLMLEAPDQVVRQVMELFHRTAIEVCEGQQMDMDFETMSNVTIDQYIEMITLKTAVLLAASLQTGAMIAGADGESCRHLYEFGKNIGVAFQLQDDILDVFGDMAKVGKVQGGDIIANKKTFLWIKAFELASHDELEELRFWSGNLNADASKKVETVTAIYNHIGIRELAEAEMARYFETAMLHLNAVNVSSERKSVLTAFAEKLMVREK